MLSGTLLAALTLAMHTSHLDSECAPPLIFRGLGLELGMAMGLPSSCSSVTVLVVQHLQISNLMSGIRL